MVTPPALALGLLLVVVLDAAPAAAQSRVPSPPPRPPVTSRRETEADRLAAMIVRTTREYVASLERMRAAYKKEADSFAEMVEVRRDLFEHRTTRVQKAPIISAPANSPRSRSDPPHPSDRKSVV